MNQSLVARGIPITVSCLLHLGLATGLILGQQWVISVAERPPILPVQLVTLDPPEEPRREEPPPPAPTPRPRIRPPRLIEPPRPVEARAARVEEPPPLPAPAPTPPAPAPVAIAPVDSPPAAASAAPGPGPLTPALPSPAGTAEAPATPAAAVSKAAPAAPEAITQYARPQGGYQVRPAYPAGPRRLGIQGTTLLRVRVLADGRIGEVLIEKTAGHSELDEAAADAVRRWRFEPARRGTEAVAMWVLLPVEFRLR